MVRPSSLPTTFHHHQMMEVVSGRSSVEARRVCGGGEDEEGEVRSGVNGVESCQDLTMSEVKRVEKEEEEVERLDVLGSDLTTVNSESSSMGEVKLGSDFTTVNSESSSMGEVKLGSNLTTVNHVEAQDSIASQPEGIDQFAQEFVKAYGEGGRLDHTPIIGTREGLALRQIPSTAYENPKFLEYIKRLNRQENIEDYIAYKIAVIGDQIEIQYRDKLDMAVEEVFYEVVKESLTWKTFSSVATKLQLQATRVQDSVMLIPAFARQLRDKMPNFGTAIGKYTTTMLDNYASEQIMDMGGWVSSFDWTDSNITIGNDFFVKWWPRVYAIGTTLSVWWYIGTPCAFKTT